jgi:ectoine hydroxylase-related dioxygenase (phytanoyl-CoA dioxygenase family)
MSTLSPTEREQFHRDGYLVIDSGLSTEVLDGCIADLDDEYVRKVNAVGHVEPCRIQDAWKASANAHAIAVAPRILDALRELYGREPRPFQTLNFPVGTLQKPHADSVHFNSGPAGFMTGVWVALEDADERNGALNYWPGSHQLPEFDMADVGVEPLEELYAEYEIFIRRAIDELGLEQKTAVVKKGQAFLWASNLIHAGGERKDPFLTRHSQVTHVYYAGCRYYTPMMSRGTYICWRNPEWIPLEVERTRRKRAPLFKK